LAKKDRKKISKRSKKEIEEEEELDDITTANIGETEIILEDSAQKKVALIRTNYNEAYDKKRRNLQIIALAMVFIITVVSPLRLLDQMSTFNYTAIGFVSASLIPALIAVFGVLKGRAFCHYLSTLIYGVWIIMQSASHWEINLMISILIIYFEVVRMLIIFDPLMKDIESISTGGAYYHANVVLGRYFKFLLKFAGVLFGTSVSLGTIAFYLIDYLPSDILFSIFMMICLALVVILSRRTLTPDIKEIILEKEKEKLQRKLQRDHSRYS